MYVEQQDFKIICDDRDYKFLSQNSDDNRNNAIIASMEECAGYLRSRFDIDAEYQKTGQERNTRLVMIVCDIALWHMVANLSDYEGFEIRQIRYNNALSWLEDVAKGNISPKLPPLIDEQTGNDKGNPIQWGNNQKRYMW